MRQRARDNWRHERDVSSPNGIQFGPETNSDFALAWSLARGYFFTSWPTLPEFLPVVHEIAQTGGGENGPIREAQRLQPTALVHEAYARLVDKDKAQHWNSRGHFSRRRPRQCGAS
jgi:hypothetical protein